MDGVVNTHWPWEPEGNAVAPRRRRAGDPERDGLRRHSGVRALVGPAGNAAMDAAAARHGRGVRIILLEVRRQTPGLGARDRELRLSRLPAKTPRLTAIWPRHSQLNCLPPEDPSVVSHKWS